MGIKSFILSGYPNLKESILFAKYILPKLDTVSFPELYKKIPQIEPLTPLCREKKIIKNYDRYHYSFNLFFSCNYCGIFW